jgi:hypothetical protein
MIKNKPEATEVPTIEEQPRHGISNTMKSALRTNPSKASSALSARES